MGRNSDWIRWTQWTSSGMVNFGQMRRADIQKQIARFEKKAREVLKETGADHVLYGVKVYDDNGKLEEVRFYMEPMDEDRFEKDVANKKGVLVYALHAKN